MATKVNSAKPADLEFDWGAIRWLCNSRIDPDAEMTFGVVVIEPGKSNPRHAHPNCEELIFVLRGACDHSLGEETLHLVQGDMLRIPRGVMHHAVNTGSEPVEMVIAYSSPNRETIAETPGAFDGYDS